MDSFMSSQKMFIVIFVILMGRWEKKIGPGFARLIFGDSIWAPWRNTGHSGVSGILCGSGLQYPMGSGLQLCDSHLPQKTSHQASKRYV